MTQAPTIPPLESGDRLELHEFERRYRAMPHLKKAELIEGLVYVPAALRFRSHAQPHGQLMLWLSTYQAFTPGTALGDNPTVRLDGTNEPQPDAVLLIEEAQGGQARISQDDYIEGAPELVAEVVASSVAIDLYEKKQAYCRNGVKEYVVWQVYNKRLDWFVLQEGRYVGLPVNDSGVIKSQVFPDLWLSVDDLLDSKMQQVLTVLQQGLSSSEHQTFL